MVPPRRVERRALEGAETGDHRREIGSIELADGAHHCVDGDLLLGTVGRANGDGPVEILVRPHGIGHFGIESDRLDQTEGLSTVPT